jgi:hypothetical protein
VTRVGAEDGHAHALEERTRYVILDDRDALFDDVGEIGEPLAVGTESSG